MVTDLVTYMLFLAIAELQIPYSMFRIFGVPQFLGAIFVFAVFGCVVFYLSRRGESADSARNG